MKIATIKYRDEAKAVEGWWGYDERGNHFAWLLLTLDSCKERASELGFTHYKVGNGPVRKFRESRAVRDREIKGRFMGQLLGLHNDVFPSGHRS